MGRIGDPIYAQAIWRSLSLVLQTDSATLLLACCAVRLLVEQNSWPKCWDDDLYCGLKTLLLGIEDDNYNMLFIGIWEISRVLQPEGQPSKNRTLFVLTAAIKYFRMSSKASTDEDFKTVFDILDKVLEMLFDELKKAERNLDPSNMMVTVLCDLIASSLHCIMTTLSKARIQLPTEEEKVPVFTKLSARALQVLDMAQGMERVSQALFVSGYKFPDLLTKLFGEFKGAMPAEVISKRIRNYVLGFLAEMKTNCMATKRNYKDGWSEIKGYFEWSLEMEEIIFGGNGAEDVHLAVLRLQTYLLAQSIRTLYHMKPKPGKKADNRLNLSRAIGIAVNGAPLIAGDQGTLTDHSQDPFVAEMKRRHFAYKLRFTMDVEKLRRRLLVIDVRDSNAADSMHALVQESHLFTIVELEDLFLHFFRAGMDSSSMLAALRAKDEKAHIREFLASMEDLLIPQGFVLKEGTLEHIAILWKIVSMEYDLINAVKPDKLSLVLKNLTQATRQVVQSAAAQGMQDKSYEVFMRDVITKRMAKTQK